MQFSNNCTKMFSSSNRNRQYCYADTEPLLCLLLNRSHFVRLIFWEARSELLPEILASSIYAFVFLSGLWEWMTNDTEGSTSRSLKLWEGYDLSLWLTCAISLHTYSNSRLNPSLFPASFSHHCAFAFSLIWSIFQDKDLLFIQRSHLNSTLLVWKGNGYESHMTMFPIKSSMRCELNEWWCTKLHRQMQTGRSALAGLLLAASKTNINKLKEILHFCLNWTLHLFDSEQKPTSEGRQAVSFWQVDSRSRFIAAPCRRCSNTSTFCQPRRHCPRCISFARSTEQASLFP